MSLRFSIKTLQSTVLHKAPQRRFISSAENSKRYLQTINSASSQTSSPINGYSIYTRGKENSSESEKQSQWMSKNSTESRKPLRKLSLNRLKPLPSKAEKSVEKKTETVAPKKRRRQLKPRKALITLTPNAIEHLRNLMNQPIPQYIKVGVQNRGCSGLSYHLEYVSKPEKFDEVVKIDDDLMIIIDSKALFSIIGSEMDYVDDKLSSRFVFNNPNSKGSCGCGESFMV